MNEDKYGEGKIKLLNEKFPQNGDVFNCSLHQDCFHGCLMAFSCFLTKLDFILSAMTPPNLRGDVRWTPREESADKVKMSLAGLVWIFMSLISSASHRKLMSLIRISSLSTHTSHHPINHNQRTTRRVRDTVAPSHGGFEAFSPARCQVFRKRAVGCICGSASLTFKGAVKVK